MKVKTPQWLKLGHIVKYLEPASAVVPSWYASRYKQLQLGNWNTGLDFSNAGDYMNMQNHSTAGSLQGRYDLNLGYTSNWGNVGADVQYYADHSNKNYASAREFMNDYNSNIDTLHNYWIQNSNHNYMDDASKHNPLFRSMYNSRSVPNSDIGYQEGLESALGSQTWLRDTDLYEKDWDELTPEEKKARTVTVNINGLPVKFGKDKIGRLVPLDEGGEHSTVTPPAVTSSDAGPSPEAEKPGDNLPAEDLGLQPVQENSKELWTDPLVIIPNAARSLMAVRRASALKKKLRFPLQEAPKEEYKITNDYYTNSLLNQKALEARLRGLDNPSSDLTENLLRQEAAENAARLYEEKALANQSTNYNNSISLALTTANKNTANEVTTANYNAKMNAAAWNNIINANNEELLKRAAIKNDTADALYRSLGRHKQVQRLNRDYKVSSAAKAQYDADVANATKAYKDFSADYTKSDAWQAFLDHARNSDDFEFSDAFNNDDNTQTFDPENLTPEQLRYLKSVWHSDAGETYRNMFAEEVSGRYDQLETAVANALKNYKAAIGNIPYQRTNQLFEWTDRRHTSPIYQKDGGQILTAAKGVKLTKASKLIDYANNMSKQHQAEDKNSLAAYKNRSELLKRDLNAIDNQTLILLKKAFS